MGPPISTNPRTTRSKGPLYLSAAVILSNWVVFSARHLLGSNPVPPRALSISIDSGLHALVVLGASWVLLRLGGETLADLGIALDRSWRGLARALLLSIGVFLVSNILLNSVLSALMGGGTTSRIATLFRDPREAPCWIFSAIVGGGFGEELERAFILTRFEKLLGRPGLAAAVIVDSLVFGLGHLYQGRVIATSTVFTGLIFALIFLWRRRVSDAMLVHAGFDLLGVAAAYALYAHGG